MTGDLGEVDRLEHVNRKLKGLLGKLPGGRDALLKLRSITLSRENVCLEDLLNEVGVKTEKEEKK